MLKRLLREPLVHFLALAAVIFAVYGTLHPAESGRSGTIVVTAPRIEQLASVFTRTWQRPPSETELKGLIDDYVREEIYVREALALGLDKDDNVIRRRLRLKMEFFGDSPVGTPTDAELQAYLEGHPDDFGIDPMMAVQQVFLDPERHGENLERDAAAIIRTLRADPTADPASLGDGSLLPAELPLTRSAAIAGIYGTDFATALDRAPTGQWTGPIRSDFGFHLVRVLDRKPGRIPGLGEVRDAVLREWSNAKRRELEEARFSELLKRYQITIENPADAGKDP